MRTKQFLIALILGLALTVPASPGSQAMPARTFGEPARLALEAPVQDPAASPSPTPDAPPPAAGEGAADTTVPKEIASVPGVTEEWWAAVQEQIRGDLYSLTAEAAEGGAATYRGYNPDHGFDLTFAGGSVRLARAVTGSEGEPSAEGEPSWTFESHTTGLGYEGEVRPLPSLDATDSDANRLEYRYPGLTEWYANDERGLEQGFTLESPPTGQGETVVLEMALDTDLVPIMTGDPEEGAAQAVEFTRPEGNVVLLRYSDLNAFDARGASLPARMALSGCEGGAGQGGCRLQLVVESASARYPLRIDPLLTAPDWAALGENPGDEFGISVGSAGDVNGDGYGDLVVGAYGYGGYQGKAYVYHGSPNGLGTAPAWTAIGQDGEHFFGYAVGPAGDVNGDAYDDLVVGEYGYPIGNRGKVYLYYGSPGGLSQGDTPNWTAEGGQDNDRFGWAVATAGDVNGDGFTDLVVGAPGYSSGSGESYVFHGSPAGLSDQAAWSRSGDPGEQFGYSVSTAGDVNGDGYDDLVVGAPLNGASSVGAASVYLGSPDGLTTGVIDWYANGENAGDYFGRSVATAGDVNGDGYADLVVGASGYDGRRGKAYVYHGSPAGLGATPDWTAIGENYWYYFGDAVGTAGDVNGDGYADLVVGGSGYGFSGKAYVYHGSPAGLGATPAWTAEAENAFGWHSCDYFGGSVATAGDVNGDGYADLIIGANGYDGYRGKAYVYHGTALGLSPPFDWTASGEGADDYFGYAVATAGDVNADGYADLVVGAYNYDGGRGIAYLFPGTSAGLDDTPAWFAEGEMPGDHFGRSVATAGDVDGDGYTDLIIGAPYNDGTGTNAGKTYLFHGSPAGLVDMSTWTAGGVNAYDNFGASVGTAGDVTGDGYADVVVAAVGYPQGQGNGKVYVYHGSSAGLSPGSADWTASGEQAMDHFGYAVGTAGDVNGDRCADLVVGAWGYEGNRGKVYVYHGSSGGLGSSPAFAASSENGGDYLGWAVGTAGDVNGDGYSDLALGAWGYDAAGNSDAGRVDLYLGSSAGITTTGAISPTGQIAGEHLGYALGTAGDVNGDGYADLIVGAEGYQYALGQVYLFRGAASGLASEPAWTATGRRGGDHFGAAVGTAGDVDGDGYSDLVVGAWGHDDPANTNAGAVYAYRGGASGSGTRFDWAPTGEGLDEVIGSMVGNAGDVNGDGYSDIAVMAYRHTYYKGKVYVYHGSADGPSPSFDWTATGERDYDFFGRAYGTAGDVNGDGYSDLAIGAYGYDGDGLSSVGKVYVYYGSAQGLETTPTWTATGGESNEFFGFSVGAAGDVNSDGYGDLVVGAYGYDGYQGKAYVYHGSAEGLASGSADWTAVGEDAENYFGETVASAGDVNGDGYADIIVGARGYDGYRGKAYVYNGSDRGLDERDGEPDWSAAGEDSNTEFGWSVATAGDANGDGFSDVVVLARRYDSWRGRLYIYHGSAHGLDVPFATFSGGDEGEANEGAISSVASAGDVNGDGFADLVVGASRAFTDTGRIYLYQGSPLGLSPTFDPIATGENEGDRFGDVVGSAGDVNGDGFADLIVGSWAHQVYAYHGSDSGGRAGLALQVRGDGSGRAVQPWGPAYTANSFGVSLHAVDPLGRGRARLQAQACPPGLPFGHTACLDQISEKWIEVSSDGEVDLRLIVSGLPEGELYRWRARAVYDSPFYSHGPWRRLMGQAQEADVRVTRLAADLSITKTLDPAEPLVTGEPITYTLAFASNGPARGVVVTDLLSSDITGTQVISSGVAITNTGHDPCCVWSVQNLDADEGGVITITGLAQVERFVNTATITGTSPDPNPANNSATIQTHIPGVLHVDRDASGAANGFSWANAFTDLQDALVEAHTGDQIWIAEGVYRPVASGPRSSSFHLVSGVALYGGFAGTERWLHERDPVAHPTILSGDINTVNNSADNVYHVVTASSSVTETALLEGLTISGGNADGNGDNGLGGGLSNEGGSPTLINVAFVGNAADRGGGLYSAGGSPTLVNVAFSGNSAEHEGGGLYNLGGSPGLTNVTFSRNTADSGGGLYSADDSALTLTNAILWGNSTGQIAGEVSNVTINHSDVQGGCPAGAICPGVLNKDPQFFDADGPDELAGTLDDDLRLHSTFRFPSPVIDSGDNGALPADIWDLDGDEDFVEPIPFDLSGRWRRVGFTDVALTVDMGAYEATIVDVLAEAGSLFGVGEAFRLENLQLLSSDTLADALKNYANFNDGEWYNAFCGDYGQIDDEGYCPEGDPQAVRNILMDAIDLYRVAVGWPTESFTTVNDIVIPVWTGGARGVLSSTTEIANVHLIFGNEFLVDATDYRFSTAGIPYADQIIAQELDELRQAQQQFELIMELVFRAFNEWRVGDYCSGDQFEQFGVASSLLMVTLNETAARYYMLRQSEAALEVYERAYVEQYLQMVALDQMAEESGDEYLQNGSWEMFNNLSQMRERAQAIHDGLDFFGFAPEYVPLQAYEQLLVLTEGPTGDTGLLGTARDLEDQARDAQRTFDANASDMATELDNLTVELNGQLFELCGESPDDYQTCTGGLMEQNFGALDAASLRVGLAYLRAQNIAEQIKIEGERAGQVIMVALGLGQELSAAELAIGKLQAVRTTRISTSSSEDQFYSGHKVSAEAYLEAYIQEEISWSGLWPETEIKAGAKAGLKETLEAVSGFQHARTWTGSTQTVWDPKAEAIAGYESLQALRQAEAQAAIEGANSAAVIRNLLLQQSEALEECQIAMAEFNKLAAEHNYLAERRSRLLNKRDQAINRVASHNSHLLSPAYRIWRDSLTTQSAGAHALAAQFAYLTARAAEYELLTPYPDLGQIFRARTSNDIRLFLNGLKVWVQALDRPGQLNRYPYTLSLARDLWGLTDQALDPEGVLSAEVRQQERYEAFQELLQASLDGDRLEFFFGTALDQQRTEGQYLFSPNIWNNRIAGIGAPLVQNEGVSINIVTRQSTDVGDPEVVLIHGGWAGGAEAYRNAAGEIVYYDPDTAVPVGYVLPAALDPANTTAVLRPGINGAGGIANSALLNLSVAAATWTFRIPAESRGNLDYRQIEDIEIVLDTTGRALPGRAAQAEQDALCLQAGLEMEPVEVELAVSAPPPVAARLAPLLTAPSIPGEIGGSYFGSVMVTSPVTIALQVLNVDLWNDGGELTGTVNVTETSLYSGTIGLHGHAEGDTLSLTSDPFVTTVAGRTVTQTLALAGQAEEEGDVLRAVYTGTIENLLPDPIPVQGKFSASRPGAAGSERLVLRPGATWVQPGAGTTITATLYDETMAVITEPRTITLTCDLGSVVPAVAETVDGQVVATFTAGGTEGQATVWATTGEITGTVRIQVSDLAPPQADFSASPIYGTAPLTVTFADLSLNDPTGWNWDFGDGTTSKEQHPTHTYVTTGTFAVSLTASNVLDADTLTRPAYVTVLEPQAPEAFFSADPTVGFAPLTVTFTDESGHSPTAWLWDFGDGGTSAEQHPEYTYYAPGTFAVTLTVSNTVGTDTLTLPGYITVREGAGIYLPLVMRNTP